MNWAFAYSSVVSISGGKIPEYFSPEMSVEEMYLTSSKNKVFLKCYLFRTRLFPLISSQSSVVQTVTASVNTELQHSKTLQMWTDGHPKCFQIQWVLVLIILGICEKPFWFEGTFLYGFLKSYGCSSRSQQRSVRSCAMYPSVGSDHSRCGVFISKRVSEAMYFVLSKSYTYHFGGEAN